MKLSGFAPEGMKAGWQFVDLPTRIITFFALTLKSTYLHPFWSTTVLCCLFTSNGARENDTFSFLILWYIPRSVRFVSSSYETSLSRIQACSCRKLWWVCSWLAALYESKVRERWQQNCGKLFRIRLRVPVLYLTGLLLVAGYTPKIRTTLTPTLILSVQDMYKSTHYHKNSLEVGNDVFAYKKVPGWTNEWATLTAANVSGVQRARTLRSDLVYRVVVRDVVVMSRGNVRACCVVR